MAVARKRPKMKRTQISLSPEQFERAKRTAAQRGVSVSQVVRDALERVEEEDRDYFERMWSIVGIVEDADPDGAEKHDEVIYGPDIR